MLLKYLHRFPHSKKMSGKFLLLVSKKFVVRPDHYRQTPYCTTFTVPAPLYE